MSPDQREAFSAFSQDPKLPTLPEEIVDLRSRDTLGRAFGLVKHPPRFLPAPDNTGLWDYRLDLISGDHNRADKAVRDALGYFAGTRLSDNLDLLEDFRFDPGSQLLRKQLVAPKYPVDIVLYTWGDVVAATHLDPDQLLLIYPREAHAVRAYHLRTVPNQPLSVIQTRLRFDTAATAVELDLTSISAISILAPSQPTEG